MSRRRLDVLSQRHFPAYVVWELTLRCDHACTHCGSRAAVARDDELTTAQALRVTDELAARGAREPLYEHLRAQGIVAWQVELTAPLGRAADRPDMILQPWDLLDLVPRVAALKERALADGIVLMPGNNLGYFGPEEALLRSPAADGDDHFGGCQAGRFVMGIESDGAIKGCPSLQTHPYAGATVRGGTPLAEIWAADPRVGSLRARTLDDLWGFCRTCPFAATCMGGCTFTAHSILGRPGNNPYCHFRARTLAARGRRERLRPLERAPGRPFDHGRFVLVEEDLDAPDPGASLSASQRVARSPRSLPVLQE